ncbi:manganese efflux pump MntP [Kangiella profundi]|uniref:Putative manganese efflux pump MntP n=1 Tax=Kangiella profundi TaxID=1561924 RepID=A0A2K9A1L3_9GAMM|nr:manganese efflux pump MntP family protein [Kangiella profundi]AUD77765.1 manganese efflux pump MntP [Kangiella profundi]GGE92766.1 membrane protein [Kangiella profundi]
MLEVIILALALSMDAFAVSIGLGSKPVDSHRKLAFQAAVYFGLFQGLMPLIGYLGGKGLLGWIEVYAPWIAFLLLLFIGGKMIFEAFSEGIEDDIAQITQRVMLTLAIATSIDAMAAGFALNLLEANPFVACGIIGLVTMLMSAIGVYIGKRSGTWLESKAELLGGVILILIAIKLVLS